MKAEPKSQQRDAQTDPPPSRARSALMAKVKSKNTSPERMVRSAVYALGYRYRLHRRGLQGTPDLVFPGKRKIIFVHGCFWHRHPHCKKASTPKTRQQFWEDKFEANVARDARNVASLEEDGWKVLVVWECEIRATTKLNERLKDFLR